MTFQLVEQVSEPQPNGMTRVEYYCRDDVTGAMFMRWVQFPTKTFDQKAVDQVLADKIVEHNTPVEQPLPAIKILESLNAILSDTKTTADQKVAAITQVHNDEVDKIDNPDLTAIPIDVTPGPIDIVPTPEPVVIASP